MSSTAQATAARLAVLLLLCLAGPMAACGPESANYARGITSVGGSEGDDGGGLGGAAGAGTGGAGGDADDGGSDAAVDQPTGAINGSACGAGSDCASTFCADGVCCESACTAQCMTCAGATPGMCMPAAADTDPRNDCVDQGASSCGLTGLCDGAGGCLLYSAGTICSSTALCNASSTAVVLSKICDGDGLCIPDTIADCAGFLCANAICRTTCASDTDCAVTSFCSAGSCAQRTDNLAGNGDLEYGTMVAWSPLGATVVSLSDTSTSGGASHAGQYSVVAANRAHAADGPSYNLPTGAGQYIVSAWALQNQNPTLDGLLRVRLICGGGTAYAMIGSSGTVLPQGVWTRITGTVDTSTVAECAASGGTPGVIKSAALFLGQSAAGAPVAFPDLYLDDLMVQVSDGHNLVGNPDFEAGVTDGWSINGAGTLAINSTVSHAGARSLAHSGRTASTAGPRYALPLGPGKYNIVFHALHAGTKVHNLFLQPTYTCLEAAQVRPSPIAKSPSVAGQSWAELSGTVTLPPVDAPAGCRLTQAAVFVQQETGVCGSTECPDLYVDDVSITLGR